MSVIRVRSFKLVLRNAKKFLIINGKGFDAVGSGEFQDVKFHINDVNGEMIEDSEVAADRFPFKNDRVIVARFENDLPEFRVFDPEKDLGAPSLTEIEVTVTNSTDSSKKGSHTEDIPLNSCGPSLNMSFSSI